MLSREHGVAFCLALRADARSGQLVRAWCCQPCCPPTALQRRPRQMTERKSDRGRDGGFVAHSAPEKTAALWNPGPEDPSAVSRHQAGRPSKARGIGLGPRNGNRLAAESRPPASFGKPCRRSWDEKVLSTRYLNSSKTVMLPVELFSPPHRAPGAPKDAPVFIRGTTPGLVGPKIEGPTETPRHARSVPRLGGPAASAVPAPHKLDIPRLLGPQVTPGANGGHYFAPWPR